MRKKYAEKFAYFMLEEESQEAVQKSKMFAVKQLGSGGDSGIMSNITPENISICKVWAVFEERKEFDVT